MPRTRTSLHDWLKAEHRRLSTELEALPASRVPGGTDLLERADGVRQEQARERREGLVRRRLADVEAALARQADGTLGTCGACGEQIDEERLAAVPTASLCRRDAGCR